MTGHGRAQKVILRRRQVEGPRRALVRGRNRRHLHRPGEELARKGRGAGRVRRRETEGVAHGHRAPEHLQRVDAVIDRKAGEEGRRSRDAVAHGHRADTCQRVFHVRRRDSCRDQRRGEGVDDAGAHREERGALGQYGAGTASETGLLMYREWTAEENCQGPAAMTQSASA